MPDSQLQNRCWCKWTLAFNTNSCERIADAVNVLLCYMEDVYHSPTMLCTHHTHNCDCCAFADADAMLEICSTKKLCFARDALNLNVNRGSKWANSANIRVIRWWRWHRSASGHLCIRKQTLHCRRLCSQFSLLLCCCCCCCCGNSRLLTLQARLNSVHSMYYIQRPTSNY